MKTAVRYFTRSGNTKKLAEAIGRAAGEEAKAVSAPLEEYADVLFLGSSVYAAGVDEAVKKFLRDNRSNIGVIYNFGTAAILPSTYKQVKKLADELGIKIAEEEFHCRGSFGIMHKSRPDEDDLKNATRFAEDVLKKAQ